MTVREHIDARSRMMAAYWPGYSAWPSQPVPQPYTAPQGQQLAEQSSQKTHPRMLAFWWVFFSGIIAGALASLSIPLGPLASGLLLCIFAFCAGFLTGRATPHAWKGAIAGLLAGSIYAAFLCFTIYAHFALLPLTISPLLAFLAASLASKKRGPHRTRSAGR